MATEEYQIIVRGETFILDRHQILFDSPNYFSSYFLGDFSEAAEGRRQLILRRDPFFFRMVQAYLSGYPVLPMPAVLPAHLSPETAIQSFLSDAQFYGLDRLTRLLRSPPETPKTIYRIQSWGYSTRCLTHLDLGPEGAQLYLESYIQNPDITLSSDPARSFGWVASEGWELYAHFEHRRGTGYNMVDHYLIEKRIQ